MCASGARAARVVDGAGRAVSDGPSDDTLARYVKELEERRGHDERPAPRVSPRERLFHVALIAVIAAVILLMKVVSALSGT